MVLKEPTKTSDKDTVFKKMQGGMSKLGMDNRLKTSLQLEGTLNHFKSDLKMIETVYLSSTKKLSYFHQLC